MKIAINLTSDSVGGITSSNLNLMNYLYKEDHEFIGLELSSFMYTKAPTLFRGFSPEIFDHHILNIHHLNLRDILEESKTLAEVKKAFKKPIQKIREILNQTRPDVVLLNGTYYMPWLISIAAEQEKIPIVLWYAGVLVKETSHLPTNLRKHYVAIEKSLVKRADKIIFPSLLCKKTVAKEVLETNIDNGYIIPNPVANTFIEPVAIDYSVEKRIAAVGRYSKIKNFDKFFDVHRELTRRHWGHSSSFVTNTTKIKKIPRNIDVLPPMTAEGLKKFYLSQGLIICPSTFETFGNVPMEAVCMGIPVLVSENMGCTEILRKVGLENMIMSFNNTKLVADRVQELCGQSILPKQLNALKRILDNSFVSEQIRAVIYQAARD